MSNSTAVWVSSALLTALAAGCGSNNQTNSDRQTNSYSQIREQEQASERREFIRDRQQKLDELDNDIARMEARLAHEARYVDAQQRAEWSQRLFELREQQRHTRAELDRAQTASPEEWAEMRGTLGNAVDSIDAGVKKLVGEMGDLFRSNQSTASSQRTGEGDVDLCQLNVEGANAELIEQDQRLVVRVTSNDERAIDALRTRAEHWKEHGMRDASDSRDGNSASRAGNPGSPSSAAQSSNLVQDVSVQNDQNGVRVIFTPAPGQRTALKQQLTSEVEQIRKQTC